MKHQFSELGLFLNVGRFQVPTEGIWRWDEQSFQLLEKAKICAYGALLVCVGLSDQQVESVIELAGCSQTNDQPCACLCQGLYEWSSSADDHDGYERSTETVGD